MISRDFTRVAMFAGATLVGALVLKAAQHSHLLSGDLAERAFEVFVGLGLAVFANFIPKTVPGLKLSPVRAARLQAAQRLNSRLFVLAGLAFAAIWAFAPINLAGLISMVELGAATAVVAANIGYCVMSRAWRNASPAH